MAGSNILLSLSLSFLVLCHGCAAQLPQGGPLWGTGYQRPQPRFPQLNECQLQDIGALEPKRETQAEAGKIQYYDENDPQFNCSGVYAMKLTIQAEGLLMTSYFNAPAVTYILQGEGLTGTIIPGCPETYRSPEPLQREEGKGEGEGEGEGEREQFRDQHQKIRVFKKGDAHVYPAGVAHWSFNPGKEDAIVLVVFHTRNAANQLGRNLKAFLLAGALQIGGQQGSEQQQAKCVLSGLDLHLLAETFGVSTETAKKLQQCDDYKKGPIFRVKKGLRVVRPMTSEEEQKQGQGKGQTDMNGYEETLCNARLSQNIDKPNRADVYNPRAGRITSLNRHKLPSLGLIGMSVERGVIYKNGILGPHFHMNAHGIIYCTKGNARVQLVGKEGKAIFNGQLKEGQLLVAPQAHLLVIQAGDEGFEYVAVKTNDDAITSPIVGQTSVFRGLPRDVLRNSYGITDEEAESLKSNRGRDPLVMESRPKEQGREQEQEQGGGQGQGVASA